MPLVVAPGRLKKSRTETHHNHQGHKRQHQPVQWWG